MTFTVGLPQFIWLTFAVISIAIHAGLHGQPKTGEYHFGVQIISIGFDLGILYWGGFFS